ncbi:hypothetical protein EJ03DRAFT_325918 [Teratosphaeria nubilosa]|uniref:Uncharacterized protein n=1 Tax=Teratosphaeria nubilosa TaxID=161662 RepID=A0A6G1LDV5_9PEZI|nr:hypothetical protein EJ03DRAFT_325918 [Teratosphaeria nubilosa]
MKCLEGVDRLMRCLVEFLDAVAVMLLMCVDRPCRDQSLYRCSWLPAAVSCCGISRDSHAESNIRVFISSLCRLAGLSGLALLSLGLSLKLETLAASRQRAPSSALLVDYDGRAHSPPVLPPVTHREPLLERSGGMSQVLYKVVCNGEVDDADAERNPVSSVRRNACSVKSIGEDR